MQIQIPHNTTKREAIARIQKLLADSQKQIAENATDVKTDWQGDVLHFEFTAQGKHISGTLAVTDTEFDIYAKLPLTLRLFEGMIERQIKAEVDKLRLR